MKLVVVPWLVFVALLVGACSGRASGTFALVGPEGQQRLRYLDGQVSLNDACAIKLSNPLSPRVRPLYVNGAPIGFC